LQFNILNDILIIMKQPLKKDNEFIINAQIIIDGSQHEIKPIKVVTPDSTPKSFYNTVKNDLMDAYKKLYPNASIAIVILPS
jgi:hypothetical protein